MSFDFLISNLLLSMKLLLSNFLKIKVQIKNAHPR